MSYAYLFKYIIIGDTGKLIVNLTYLYRLKKVFNYVFANRCREILPFVAVHGQTISACSRFDDW